MALVPTAAHSGTQSPLTTKGDLYGFDTANDRVPVGADTQVLTADSTQALGIKWAAPAAPAVAVTQISDKLLAVDTASFDFTSIPTSYNHLMLWVIARTTNAAASGSLTTTINNLGTAIYNVEQSLASANTVGGSNAIAASAIAQVAVPGGASVDSRYRGVYVFFFPYYADTSGYKHFLMLGGDREGNLAANYFARFNFYGVDTSLAITRITLAAASNNIAAGSRATLYGLT